LSSAVENGFLPIHFAYHDVDLSTTLYNGLLPDGTRAPDTSELPPEKAIVVERSIKAKLVNYLSKTDNTPEQITAYHINYRMEELSNFFNVTCDKCGTPHSYKMDVPLTNLNCALCDHPLVFYYGLDDEAQQKIKDLIKQQAI